MHPSLFLYLTVTNNPYIIERVKGAKLLKGTALDVMTEARNLVHAGWNLVTSPLYGNFKPNQQPYRTIVLSKWKGVNNMPTDFEFLNYLEEAISIYKDAPIIRQVGEFSEEIDIDFRQLDFMLMSKTFQNCGLLLSPLN